MQILIVEPRKKQAQVYMKIAQEAGFNARAVPSAIDCFRSLRNEKFDAIISSRHIIDIPGEMMRHLLKNSASTARLPIFVASSPEDDMASLKSFLEQISNEGTGNDAKKDQ